MSYATAKRFDYARAWKERSRPGYDTLPADVRALFIRTAEETAELHQLPDCSMPWPEASDLRERFSKIPAEILSIASHIVHDLGHHRPSGGELPAAEDAAVRLGAHWKFSHYADQSLRDRLNVPDRGSLTPNGMSLAIHEGAIRICYSSDHSWMGHEWAPATANGVESANKAAGRVRAAFGHIHRGHKSKRDRAAWEAFEAIKASPEPWPESWQAWTVIGRGIDAYMVEPGLEDVPVDRLVKLQAKAAKLRAELEPKIEKYAASERREVDGKAWWLERGISDDNLIYYAHTDTFCFGWRDPVGPVFASAILDLVSEFPYPYEIRQAEGGILKGGHS